MSDQFCVTIKHCHSNPDQCTVGFVVANAALGSDKKTLVFLSTDGVMAAKQGEAEKIDEGEPFKPLKELIDMFMGAGGRVIACAPCCKKRGIDESNILPGVEIAGGGALVAWLSDGPECVDY